MLGFSTMDGCTPATANQCRDNSGIRGQGNDTGLEKSFKLINFDDDDDDDDDPNLDDSSDISLDRDKP
jgi:hypothetical protein